MLCALGQEWHLPRRLPEDWGGLGLGEEPSGKRKGKGLNFISQGPLSGVHTPQQALKMTFFHQKGTGRNFLTSYMRLISCLKSLFLFIMMNAQLLSFVAGGVWDPKNAGYCTKLPILWRGGLVCFIFYPTPSSHQWTPKRGSVNAF